MKRKENEESFRTTFRVGKRGKMGAKLCRGGMNKKAPEHFRSERYGNLAEKASTWLCCPAAKIIKHRPCFPVRRNGKGRQVWGRKECIGNVHRFSVCDYNYSIWPFYLLCDIFYPVAVCGSPREKSISHIEKSDCVAPSDPLLCCLSPYSQPYALNIIAEFDFSADFELTLWLTLYVGTCTVPLGGTFLGLIRWSGVRKRLYPTNALEQLAFRHKRAWFVGTTIGGWGSMEIILFDSLIIILFMYTEQTWIIYVSSPFWLLTAFIVLRNPRKQPARDLMLCEACIVLQGKYKIFNWKISSVNDCGVEKGGRKIMKTFPAMLINDTIKIYVNGERDC